MKQILLIISFALIAAGSIILITIYYKEKNTFLSPLVSETENPKHPLDKYTFENLKNTNFPKKDFAITDQISQNPLYTSNIFVMRNNTSSVSGLINIPKTKKPLGTIILIRGYVDREVYESGMGTKRIGEKLASNGFVTVSPDFLGYGTSSWPSGDPLEERFQTYTTVLSLINSLPENLPSKIGLFGHSNGGHIAIAALEVTGRNFPAVLWAPVSKPFPYSILYYTDEFDDKGKALRKLVSNFEKDYDVFKYSIDNYLDWINAPLQINQGLADQEVPYWWSDELVQTLKDKNKEVEYYKYPGEDHNFNGGTWDILAARTLNFYLKHFTKP